MKDYKNLKRTLCFTDIHFGKSSNSPEHNQKCLDFIDFCCENVKKYNIDFISFLGDYFENRNALNVSTINYAYEGITRLNNLGIPIFLKIGNHDLYQKNSRKYHSLVMFKEFSNVTVIEEPTVIEFHKKIFMCPWLVNNEEYDSINNYDADYMFAHMDLNDFVMSGTDTVCDHGISHKKLSKFETVLIGHYHRRQTKDNVTYIGNPFSTSYGELDDNKGFTVFDLEHNTLELVKFDGPRYCKVNLSDIIDNRVEIPDNVNCKIIADVSIEYSELMELKKTIQESRNVLSLSFEELPVKYYADDVEEISDTRNISINDSIIEMLKNIESKEINNKLLVKIYNSL